MTTALLDLAEGLGVRGVLEMMASSLSGRRTWWSHEICKCDPPPDRAGVSSRRILQFVTHDIDCPIHRFVVLCGTPADKAELTNRAHDYAVALLYILDNPDEQTVQDYRLAEAVIGRRT